MKTALFHNFTDKPFTGMWDGESETFQPGEQKFMPAYLAEHYAKHLVNRVLLEKGDVGATSPKNPEQVPAFYNLFLKACIIQDNAPDQKQAQLETDLLNRKNPSPELPVEINKKAPQVVEGPADPDDEDFEGLKDPSSMTEAK